MAYWQGSLTPSLAVTVSVKNSVHVHVCFGEVVSGPPQGVSSWEGTPRGEIQKPRTPWLSSTECIFPFFSSFAPLPLLFALSFLPPSLLWVFCLSWCEWCLNWFKNTKLRLPSKICSPWSPGKLVQLRCDCSWTIQHLCNTGVTVVRLFSSSGRIEGVQIIRLYFFLINTIDLSQPVKWSVCWKKLFQIYFICVFCLHICVCNICMSGAHRVQERCQIPCHWSYR